MKKRAGGWPLNGKYTSVCRMIAPVATAVLLMAVLGGCGSTSSTGSSSYSPPTTLTTFCTGSCAYLEVYETASAGAVASGNVYVLVNGDWGGTLSGYFSTGGPTCNENTISAVSILVQPSTTYQVSAHDSGSNSWPTQSVTTNPAGQCSYVPLN